MLLLVTLQASAHHKCIQFKTLEVCDTFKSHKNKTVLRCLIWNYFKKTFPAILDMKNANEW